MKISEKIRETLIILSQKLEDPLKNYKRGSKFITKITRKIPAYQ